MGGPRPVISSAGVQSPRLRYRSLTFADVDGFHRLAQDDHIRRYLLDGNLVSRPWCEERVRDSQALLASRGLGLWLVDDGSDGQLLGFCGFLVFPELEPEPQLVYALLAGFTGQGYATEMARACIAEARRVGCDEIRASVDEVNAASMRVLEKLGFERVSVGTGAFGNLLTLRLPVGP
jgi:[ribosomal protein S5]-alanine N-acetyltransferase